MKKEVPKQYDLFSGELADNRTAKQRREDRQRDDWTQMPMFKLSETYELGAPRKPWLKDLPNWTLVLGSEDVRTPEEIEADLMREAQKLTVPMFEPQPTATETEVTADIQTEPTPGSITGVPIEGLRAQMRRTAVRVRRRVHAVNEKAPQSGGG